MGGLLATLRSVLPTSSIASEPEEKPSEVDSRSYYYNEAPVEETNYSNVRTEYNVINEEVKSQYIQEKKDYEQPYFAELTTVQAAPGQHATISEITEVSPKTQPEIPEPKIVVEKAFEEKATVEARFEKEIVQEIPKEIVAITEEKTIKETPVENVTIKEIPVVLTTKTSPPLDVVAVEEIITKEQVTSQELSPKEQEKVDSEQVDIDDTEDDSSRAKAAVKIQALYRGYTTRKQIDVHKGDSTCQCENSESDVCGISNICGEIISKPLELDEPEWKNQKQVHFVLDENDVELCKTTENETLLTNTSNRDEIKVPPQENENLEEDNELIEDSDGSQPHKVEAAVKIQAAFRGHIVRKEMKKKNNPTCNIDEYDEEGEEEEDEEEEETESQEISEEEIEEEDEVISVDSKGRCVKVNDDETF